MRYSIRYAVVNSQMTLPVACVIGSLFWLFGDITHWSRWTGWVVTMVTTVAVMEWNHRATLIRQRNRMASTTFIVLMTIAAFLQDWSPAMLATLCFVIANIILCYTFQSRKCQGLAYHAFVMLGIGSLFFPPLLYIIPFMIFSMGVQLRSLTWRSLVAALLGVLTPYWLYFVWHFCMGSLEGSFDFFLTAMAPRGISYATLTHKEVIVLIFTAFYASISMLDYIRTYYQDKLQTRMFIYTIFIQDVALMLMIIFLPHHFDGFMRLFIAASAPIIGHHLTLSRGTLVNWYFICTLAVTVILTIYTRV